VLPVKRYRSLGRSLSDAPPTAPPTRNPFKKIAFYIRNDPFARVSLVFGGVVLTVLLVIEAFIPKEPKRVKYQVSILPPTVGHFTVPRLIEIKSLLKARPSWFSTSPSVSMVTGPSGSGKTQLISQFVPHFTSSSSPLISKKESLKPIVVYIDAGDPGKLERSIRYVAQYLGLELVTMVTVEHALESIFKKLGSQKAKWLLIIDGVKPDIAPLINKVIKEKTSNDRKLRKGYILISTDDDSIGFDNMKKKVDLDKGLTPNQANELFIELSGLEMSNLVIDELLSQLSYHPLSLSLAAMTLNLYRQFYSSSVEDCEQLAKDYRDILMESHDDHMISRLIKLYVEALCSADNYFLHSVDFISSCKSDHLLPSSSLRQHLKNRFYRLPSNPGSSPFQVTPIDTTPSNVSSNEAISYLSMIKSKIPFLKGDNQEISVNASRFPSQVDGEDVLTTLFLSPFIHKWNRDGLELLSLHDSCSESLKYHFLSHTVPRLEAEHLAASEVRWNETTWFKKFKTFDPDDCLMKYRHSLPGISGNKLLNQEKFNQLYPSDDYIEYIHLVSHHHRVLEALHEDLKYLSRDKEDQAIRNYLRSHVEFISAKYLSEQDQLRCKASLLSIDATSWSKGDARLNEFNDLLREAKVVYGSSHFEVSNILTMIGEVLYYSGNFEDAKNTLCTAVEIQERSSLKSPSHKMDNAVTLAMLGLTYSSLGKKELCKQSLEKALTLFQTIPNDGNVSKKQRKIVSTTVTDLGHAYVSTGDVIGAKRYLDLAIMAQRGIHGDYHPEVVRTLNVLSIVYSLLGDNSESRSCRKEAGKIESELQKQIL
jgi:tetratricopeptide (TPR) repeat protein/molybdopterin-guanine dinucleotide biosynthesis protein